MNRIRQSLISSMLSVRTVISVNNMQCSPTFSCIPDAVFDRHNIIVPAMHDKNRNIGRRGCQSLKLRHVISRSKHKQTGCIQFASCGSCDMPAHARAHQHQWIVAARARHLSIS